MPPTLNIPDGDLIPQHDLKSLHDTVDGRIGAEVLEHIPDLVLAVADKSEDVNLA